MLPVEYGGPSDYQGSYRFFIRNIRVHTIARLLTHMVTKVLTHMVTRALTHMVTRVLTHMVTRALRLIRATRFTKLIVSHS